MRLLLTILTVAILSTACSETENRPEVCASDGVDFAAMFQDRYVKPFKEGRTEEWLQVFTIDAVALHNHRRVDVGLESISSFGKAVAETFRFAQYEVDVTDTRANCDWAISRGEYQSEFIFQESGEPAPWGLQKGIFSNLGVAGRRGMENFYRYG